MKIEVVCKDNRAMLVDDSQLDDMLANNKISMFRRSNGWAMAGVDATRGFTKTLWGGIFEYVGPDRRDLSGSFMDECAYILYTQGSTR